MMNKFKVIPLFLFIIFCSFHGSVAQYHSGEPKWSADGKEIVFVGAEKFENVEGKYPGGRNVMIMNSDGSKKKTLTSQTTYANEYPILSPDGKTILFSSNREGAWKFFVVNRDGTNERDLGMESTSSVWNDPCRAVWSPDGKQFCFPKVVNNQRILHLANRDGTGVKPIGDVVGIHPQWSPDGKSIAFYRKGNIHSVHIDGTGYKQLTNNADPDSYATRPMYPQWSKDGRSIFYIKGDHVFKMDADGAHERQVTNTPGQKWYLGISSKNKILYGAIDHDRDKLYICEMDGSNVRCLTP